MKFARQNQIGGQYKNECRCQKEKLRPPQTLNSQRT